MDIIQETAALVRSLGAGFGVELELDAGGACGMRIDDRLDLTLRHEPNPPRLLVYSPVGLLSDGPVEAVLRRLLEANHVWDGTRGATWSLSGNEVVLSRLFPLWNLEAEALASELAVFVEVALAGQQALQSSSTPAGAMQPAYGIPPAVPGGLPPGAIAP